jgi:hypothetical protein
MSILTVALSPMISTFASASPRSLSVPSANPTTKESAGTIPSLLAVDSYRASNHSRSQSYIAYR